MDNNGTDPGNLVTGLTPGPFNEQESDTTSKELEAQQRQRNSLLPVATDIFAFVKDEKAAIGDIRAYRKSLGPRPTKAQIEDEYRARELYIGYLERFEQWMTVRLQKSPAKQLTRKPTKR